MIVALLGDFRPTHLWFSRGAHVRTPGQTLPVCALPSPGSGVQPMRPWPTLLRCRVRRHFPTDPTTRGRESLPARPQWASQTRGPHAPMAPAPRRISKDSDASGFPCRPCRCCTGGQRITPGNLARFTDSNAMQHIRPQLEQRKHQHRSSTSIGLALPLVPITMPGAGAPELSSTQQVRA